MTMRLRRLLSLLRSRSAEASELSTEGASPHQLAGTTRTKASWCGTAISARPQRGWDLMLTRLA